MVRTLLCIGFATALTIVASPAEAKTIGGCPRGASWTLTSLVDLGVTPGSDVNPSLDGNGDGYTCIMWQHLPTGDYFVYRDNTV